MCLIYYIINIDNAVVILYSDVPNSERICLFAKPPHNIPNYIVLSSATRPETRGADAHQKYIKIDNNAECVISI